MEDFRRAKSAIVTDETDLTDDVIREIQAQASKDMAGEEWIFLAGYSPTTLVGRLRKTFTGIIKVFSSETSSKNIEN